MKWKRKKLRWRPEPEGANKFDVCPTSGKVIYLNQSEADSTPPFNQKSYLCESCDFWHKSSMGARIT